MSRRKHVYAAVVTPFTADERIDADSARRAYGWALAQGVDGLMLFGSMGEGPLLTADLREELARAGLDARRAHGGKIIFCLQDGSEKRIREQMERLAVHDHDYWAIPFPGGMGRPADPVGFLHGLLDAADRPTFYYHNPGASGIEPSLPRWRALLEHPKLAGVKNSAGGMRVRKELCRLRAGRDFTLLEGDEWAVDEALWLGCDGMLVGMGLLGARLFVALARAADAGDFAAARRLQDELISVYHAVYGEDVSTWCVGQKHALVRMGLFDGATTLVDGQRELDAAARSRIDAFIDARPEWFPRVG